MERSRAVSSRKYTGFVCMSSAATLYTPPQMKPAVPATTTSGTPINQTRLRVFGCIRVLRSEPDPHARHDTGVLDITGLRATEVCGSAVGTLPDHADIRRELSMELVAQPETGFDLAQSAADSNRRIILAPGFALDQPLADQPVGEQHFVFGFRAETDLAGLAHVGGRFDFELVRGETDDTKRGIGARWTAVETEVMADTGDRVPPGGDGPTVQDFHIRRLGGSARTLALAAEPEPVQVGADPGFRFPGHAGAVLIRVPGLKPVKRPVGVDRFAVHYVRIEVLERRGPIGRRDDRNRLVRLRGRRKILAGTRLMAHRRVVHARVIHLGVVHRGV